MVKNYSTTLRACYLGFITQAIASNFAPLLFLRFRFEYGVSLGRIALISSVFYFVQLIVDVICARYVDMIGYRKSVVMSEVLSGAGLIGLAVLPDVFRDPFTGIIVSVVIYAVGSGLIEVLVSPIVEACPFDNKASVMTLLHSFYCWGTVGVIVLSTAFFSIFGIGRWKIMACIWALIPIYNVYNFSVCPIERLVDEGKSMTVGQLLRSGTMWAGIILMVCAGSSELAMAQWASAFAESALGLEKTAGDLLGPCLFAVTMGLCRVLYGKFGGRIELTKFMAASGILCVTCYLLASISQNPAVGLIGCIMCGFSVGVMWPGTISILSKKMPSGGTAMFALLAMAGDMGGSVGPSIVGFVTDAAAGDLRPGLLAGAVFPLILTLMIIFGMRKGPESRK